MAALTARPVLTVTVNLSLTEAEMKALYELSQYGPDKVVEFIGRHVSAGLERDHGGALTGFLTAIREQGIDIIDRAHKARTVFNREP